MNMAYIKIWLDWREATSTLKDAEKGRLIDAVVAYANGEDPDGLLAGNERFVFPIFRLQMDRDRAKLEQTYEVRAAAGRKGGLAKAANASKDHKTIRRTTKDEKPKTEDYTGDIPPESPPGQVFAYSPEFERFWAAYPKKASKGDAYKAFNRITGVPLSVMLYAIDDQRHSRQWTEDNGRYIPNPATWLNRRNWENGPTETEPQSNGNTFAELARELEKEEQHEPF